MQIIEPGTPGKVIQEYQFHCNACGCVFIATESDGVIYSSSGRNEDNYYCKCPTCNARVLGTEYFNRLKTYD